MDQDVVKIDTGDGQISLAINELPSEINKKIDYIDDLEKKIRLSANDALSFVHNQMKRYEDKKILGIEYKSGDTKDIISDSQKAIEKLADSQMVSVEALKLSFSFQKELAKVAKDLFKIGSCNIAYTRKTISIIEAKLSGASKEQLSELAQQELLNVVNELKAQEDIMLKQERLKEHVQNAVARLDEKDRIDERQDQQINQLRSFMDSSKTKASNNSKGALSIIALVLAIISLIVSILSYIK